MNSLLNGEADIADASRILKNKDYGKFDNCDDTVVDEETGSTSVPCNGVLPVKWVVAFDVLATIVHPDNTWATELNFSQLYSIFTDDNPATHWDDVPGLENAPHEEIEYTLRMKRVEHLIFSLNLLSMIGVEILRKQEHVWSLEMVFTILQQMIT